MRYLTLIIFCFQLMYSTGAEGQGSILPYTTVDLVDLDAFKPLSSNWALVADVSFDPNNKESVDVVPGAGILLNRLAKSGNGHLITNFEHGDLDVELDFMMAKGSNSGVYLQGRYEIQLFDSWVVAHPKFSDAGGIYQRWDRQRGEGRMGYEGHPPLVNVSKAPGLWQQLKIRFRAPRFDAQGNKIENARFIEVFLNGVLIQKNIELTGPTRAAMFEDENALGPLMIQGDHGPVAIRNIKYKAYGAENVSLSGMKLTSYDSISSLEDFTSKAPRSQMDIDVLAHLAPASRSEFAGTIEGTIRVPETGEYHFNLDLAWIPNETNPDRINGGGEFRIEDTKVLALDGKSSSASGAIKLDAGSHPFKLSYLKKFGFWYARSNDITLSVEGPNVGLTVLRPPLRAADPVGAILVRVNDRTDMQRGFFNHQGVKKTHVIAVGEPGGANYALDLSNGSLLSIWRGDFVETTPMWHGRGETQLMVPLGSMIEFGGKPSVAYLSNDKEEWPQSHSSYTYLGYDISEQDKPILKYSLGKTLVKESLETKEEGRKLSRTIMVEQQDGTMWCLLAEGTRIEKMPSGLYSVDGKQYYIEVEGNEKAIIRNSSGGMELLLPITGKNKGRVTYSMVW